MAEFTARNKTINSQSSKDILDVEMVDNATVGFAKCIYDNNDNTIHCTKRNTQQHLR